MIDALEYPLQMTNEKTTILIIEDDTPQRANLVELFELFEYDGLINAIGARDGREGLEKIHEHHPDLILCDIMMPVMDGYEVLAALKADPNLANIPFVFVTARAEKEDLRRGVESGADAYITKPWSVSDLLHIVLSMLSKRKTVREEDPKNQFDVFLSYSRKDLEVMKQIRDSLVIRDLKVWTDENLEPGTPSWIQLIEETMEASGCVVAVLSPDAKSSIWVKRELILAENLKKSIFPILVRGNTLEAVPLNLITHQHVDIRQGYEKSIIKIVQSVRKNLKLD